MRLTAYSDYALRVLIYLTIQDERLATIREISEQYSISKNHLMKLVHDLGKHGFVETVRGKNGGLRIARDPGKISVGEVVRVMEKDMSIVECFDPDNYDCQISEACALKGIMRKATNSFLDVLDEYSVKDLTKAKSRLINSFPIDVWSNPDNN